jgi:hypothetical protein
MTRWAKPVALARMSGRSNTIGIGPRDHFIADIGAGASPVLDDGLLAPDFRELLGDDAGDNVRWPSRGKRHNEAHDSIGPIQRLHLHPRGTTAKAERECGPGGQSNQAAAREHEYPWLHLFYPSRERLRTA